MEIANQDLNDIIRNFPVNEADRLLDFMEQHFQLTAWLEEDSDDGKTRWRKITLAENWTPEVETIYRLIAAAADWHRRFVLKQMDMFPALPVEQPKPEVTLFDLIGVA